MEGSFYYQLFLLCVCKSLALQFCCRCCFCFFFFFIPRFSVFTLRVKENFLFICFCFFLTRLYYLVQPYSFGLCCARVSFGPTLRYFSLYPFFFFRLTHFFSFYHSFSAFSFWRRLLVAFLLPHRTSWSILLFSLLSSARRAVAGVIVAHLQSLFILPSAYCPTLLISFHIVSFRVVSSIVPCIQPY